jgi:hypothetical protein
MLPTLLPLFACVTSFAGDSVRLPFLPNAGQDPPEVAFRAATSSGGAFVTRNGELVYGLADGAWLRESFVAGRSTPFGATPARATASFYLGNDPSRWSVALPSYESIDLGEVWRGVRVELSAHDSCVEKVFAIAPGADPSSIRISLEGACELRVRSDRALIASTGAGEVVFTAPIAWQMNGEVRESVEVAYELGEALYGFRVGPYDAGRELWIDPALRSTYLGGMGNEDATCAVVDPATGKLYVCGGTTSVDFPGVAGGAITSKAASARRRRAKSASRCARLGGRATIGSLARKRRRSSASSATPA